MARFRASTASISPPCASLAFACWNQAPSDLGSSSEKALAYARAASELDPKSDGAWFQQAKAREAQGGLIDAVDALNRAISLNPRASSYYYVLAHVYRRLGNLEDSQKAL